MKSSGYKGFACVFFCLRLLPCAVIKNGDYDDDDDDKKKVLPFFVLLTKLQNFIMFGWVGVTSKQTNSRISYDLNRDKDIIFKYLCNGYQYGTVLMYLLMFIEILYAPLNANEIPLSIFMRSIRHARVSSERLL